MQLLGHPMCIHTIVHFPSLSSAEGNSFVLNSIRRSLQPHQPWLFTSLCSATRPCRIRCGKSMSELWTVAKDCLMKAPRKEPGIQGEYNGEDFVLTVFTESSSGRQGNHATITSLCFQHCKGSIKILHGKKWRNVQRCLDSDWKGVMK